jgi:hypothetical protein
MIEIGRHNRPRTPRDERTCHMCNDKMEDEVHFFTECNIYGSQNKFWQTIHTKYPQTSHLTLEERFVFIMTQEDTECIELMLKKNHEWQMLRAFLCEYFYQTKNDNDNPPSN